MTTTTMTDPPKSGQEQQVASAAVAFMVDQYSQIMKLQQDNTSLSEKNKHLSEQLQRQQQEQGTQEVSAAQKQPSFVTIFSFRLNVEPKLNLRDASDCSTLLDRVLEHLKLGQNAGKLSMVKEETSCHRILSFGCTCNHDRQEAVLRLVQPIDDLGFWELQVSSRHHVVECPVMDLVTAALQSTPRLSFQARPKKTVDGVESTAVMETCASLDKEHGAFVSDDKKRAAETASSLEEGPLKMPRMTTDGQDPKTATVFPIESNENQESVNVKVERLEKEWKGKVEQMEKDLRNEQNLRCAANEKATALEKELFLMKNRVGTYTDRIAQLEQELEKERSLNHRDNFDKEMIEYLEKSKEDAILKISRLEKEIVDKGAEATRSMEVLRAELDSERAIRVSAVESVDTLQSKLDTLKETVQAEVKEKHDAEVRALKDAHEAALKTRDANFEACLKSLQDGYEEKIVTNAREAMPIVLTALEDRITSLETENEALRARLETDTDIASLEADLTRFGGDVALALSRRFGFGVYRPWPTEVRDDSAP